MSHVVTLRLPEDLGGRLDALAKRTHRTKAFYVREALAAHLEDLEDSYLAAEVSRQVDAGEQQVYEWAEVMLELGFDDLAEPARVGSERLQRRSAEADSPQS